MISWRNATVVSVGRAWAGAVELTAQVHPPEGIEDGRGDEVRALAYTALTGEPAPGDRVLLNVTAQVRGLGTGGYALVVARPDALPDDPPPAPGHLVKARYTPLQAMVLGVDEQESPDHEVLRDADDLHGMPVVVADLHSSLPAVVAGIRHHAARLGTSPPRIAYVMTDGGALPAAFSRTVQTLRASGLLDVCISVGQAFGGDLEAVTVHTGLLAARHVRAADVAVVIQGPGNLGTGTRWGFSGVAAGEAVNAAAVLGGRPVAALRVSGADARPRHRGLSHHSATAYGRVALMAADVVVPTAHPGAALGDLWAQVHAEASALCHPHGPHTLVEVPVDEDLTAALRALPLRLSTMGRDLDEDPGSFLSAAAAGVHAADLLAG